MPAVASMLDCSQYSMWPSALCRRRSLSPSGVTTRSARCFSRWSSRPVSPARYAACPSFDPITVCGAPCSTALRGREGAAEAVIVVIRSVWRQSGIVKDRLCLPQIARRHNSTMMEEQGKPMRPPQTQRALAIKRQSWASRREEKVLCMMHIF